MTARMLMAYDTRNLRPTFALIDVGLALETLQTDHDTQGYSIGPKVPLLDGVLKRTVLR